MKPGDVVEERFELVALAGHGGMGTVWRARDRAAGDVADADVAVKVLRDDVPDPDARDRFLREQRLLAELRHPYLVRYVASGVMDGSTPYLVMEWLDGTDLSTHLSRTRLSPLDALALAERLAEALGVAHARGVVHRDVKPSNVILVGDDLGRAKLIDFGLARRMDATFALTRAGVPLGTPGYVAPEQALGRPVDARADLYSLGCLLYRMLTGHRPFEGDDPIAVMCRAALQDAPPLSRWVHEPPAALEAIAARLLAREPDARPSDGAGAALELAEVRAELRSTGHGLRLSPPGAGPMNEKTLTIVDERTEAPRVSRDEARLVAVVVASSPVREGKGARRPRVDDETVKITDVPVLPLVDAVGGRLERLSGGATAIVVAPRAVSSDLGPRVARCAVDLARLMPSSVVAAVIARESADHAVNAAIVHAMRLLASPHAFAPDAVRVDDATAVLVGPDFETRPVDGAPNLFELRVVGGDASTRADIRSLLGKSTPLVGREHELGMLSAIFTQCAEGPEARAAIVIGAPGVGKSRLRAELVHRLRGDGSAYVWVARADPTRAGSPMMMLGELVRSDAGFDDAASTSAKQSALRERIERVLADRPEDIERATTFLAEVVGAPFDAEGRLWLAAARVDARLMSDQIGRAIEDYASALASDKPLLIVLEDAQWGDAATIGVIDRMLDRLAQSPIMVLVLARPAAKEAFGELFARRARTEIWLASLGKRAAAALVRAALGERVEDARVDAIVERAAGNAFFLEELVRAEAEGRGGELPETVGIVLQDRLLGLDSEARRVLRAASVLGLTAWTGGIARLVGASEAATTEWIAYLVDREILAARTESRFAGHAEFRFRHALLRDAAYAMLTESDRALAHGLAASWLLDRGETDAAVIASHWELSNERRKAIPYCLLAAQAALEADDAAGALDFARRAIALDPTPIDRGSALALAAHAHAIRAEYVDARATGEQALAALPSEDPRWALVARRLVSTYAGAEKRERVLALTNQLLELPHTEHRLVVVARMVAITHTILGDDAKLILDRVRASARENALESVALDAALALADAWGALSRGDLPKFIEGSEIAARYAETIGDLREACARRIGAAWARGGLGLFELAKADIERAMAFAEKARLTQIRAEAAENLGAVLVRLGRTSEAKELLVDALATFRRGGDVWMESGTRIDLAHCHLARGELHDAEIHARAAIAATDAAQDFKADAYAAAAEVAVARGALEEAATLARESLAYARSGFPFGEPRARLALARAERGLGDAEAARAVALDARDRLLARAEAIPDLKTRAAFLERVEENAQTLLLAATLEAEIPRSL
ncbi:MAG: protein kinase [Polyangiaceae bacterium]